MFKVNNIPILAEDIDVLQRLKESLAEHGIERFAQFKIGPNNIQFNCPIHSEGQERRPSCGISTKATEKHPAGTVHCFSCGYTATLEEMISHCFGYNDFGAYGKKWLISNFISGTESRRTVDFDFSRDTIKKEPPTYISEQELEKYRYYHPYMYKRKLTDEVIDKFDIGYDKAFKLGGRTLRCITFPVRDETGGTLFLGRRCIDQKIFHYPTGVEKPVYGLYELPEDVTEVIICESVFNALTCYVYGRPAVALLGTGTEAQIACLQRFPCRKYILAFDADKAGYRACKKVKKALDNKVVTHFIIPEGKDINDLSQAEFDALEEVF